MIQFSKPRRPFDRNSNMNRFQHDARDMLGGTASNGGGKLLVIFSAFPTALITQKSFSSGQGNGLSSRFDSAFFRGHDAISSIPSDAQSVRSQATYSSGLPTFSQAGSTYPSSVKRSASSYASSTFSQDLLSSNDASSIRDDAASSIGFSQADRLDASSEYKGPGAWTEYEESAYTGSQAGLTEY